MSSCFTVRAGLVAICIGALAVMAGSGQADARANPLAMIVATTQPSVDTTQSLQNAVHRLNAWLSNSTESDGWRRALLLNVLDTQSALGEQANVATLNSIYNKFCSGRGGLDHPAFRDVRIALWQQIEHLSTSRVGDLFAAVTTARGQYQPITVTEMARQRDQAKYELGLLKKYYRQTMPSRPRANLFYDLKLNNVIEYLDTIAFEVAPEISVGKIGSMIGEVEEQLDEVIREIDALPFESAQDEPAKENPQDIEPLDGSDRPEPDNSVPTRDDLEKERKKLEAQIGELKEQRRAVQIEDKPRQDLRQQTFRMLRIYELNFVNASQDQGDPYFVSAVLSLERFVRTYFFGTADNLQEDFLKRLEDLETDLLDLDGPEARDAAGKVGDHLRWMENANQIPNVVTSIRARYSNPNLFVSFSSRLLNVIGSKSASDARYLRESIDGRLVRGRLYTNAHVNIELQNDPNQVHASIHLVGDISSSTYVEQGKIRAFASTGGQLEGRRSVYANIGGLHASDPKVAANIQASFLGTNSPLRFVNRIAGKKFAEVRGKTEGSTARKAEAELLEQFESQTDEPVSNGKKALDDLQDRIIANTNLLPEIYLRSFTSEIMAIGKKSSIATLAALDMPAPSIVPSDVSVRVHDSMLSNFFDRSFSGKTFTDEELEAEIGSMFGQEPDALADKKADNAGDDESFSITFADIRPIQFEFENNGFRVVASGRRFAQADNRINEGLKIILRFKIKRIAGKLRFVRDGKAEIEYLEEDYRPKTVAFRTFLLGKLNPEEGDIEQVDVELPDNLLPIDRMEALKDGEIAKRLELIQCRSENGWLYLGWNHRAENTYPIWQYDTPAIWTEAVVTGMQEPYLMQPNSLDQPILNQPLIIEPPILIQQ